MKEKTLKGSVACVTGASRGFGRAIACLLAQEGAHVVALARGVKDLEALDDSIQQGGGQATLVPCDLQDFDALDRLGAHIFERWGKLDIFIANAAILGPLTPLAHIDPQIWETCFAINVTANWRLIRSFDLLFRRAPAGRLVFLSSSVTQISLGRPYWGAYTISKTALESLACHYAAETLTTSSIKVMIVHPGPMRTEMRAQAMPGEDPMVLRTPEELAPRLLPLCLPKWEESGKIYDLRNQAIIG